MRRDHPKIFGRPNAHHHGSWGKTMIFCRKETKKIALVINTGGGNTEYRLSDAIALRRATLKNKVPYCTNMSTAQACLEAIKSLKTKKLEVTSLQDI